MADHASDKELAQLVLSTGDEAAFRLLYRRHTPYVYGFVLRLVGGNTAEAEDITQETWLRAARGLENFQWRSSLRSWLIGIALNRVREMARRKGRELTTVGVEFEIPDGVRDPGQRIDLERALELLPPGFRTVLVLHDVEGFTHREIGERLGITDGTSKSQLHGARRAMRRLLDVGLEMA
jgi:RNA polymerase sigma-70 factor (ECF subfamily)